LTKRPSRVALLLAWGYCGEQSSMGLARSKSCTGFLERSLLLTPARRRSQERSGALILSNGREPAAHKNVLTNAIASVTNKPRQLQPAWESSLAPGQCRGPCTNTLASLGRRKPPVQAFASHVKGRRRGLATGNPLVYGGRESCRRRNVAGEPKRSASRPTLGWCSIGSWSPAPGW
jgi:hypothetical protein